MSFRGGSVHTINDAGRVSIPAKMREVLRSTYSDDTLIVYLGIKHIKVYPLAEWGKLERQLIEQTEAPEAEEAEINAIRFMLSNLDEVVVDKQGRILISPALRNAARLNGECMIVGRFTFFEIWDKACWDENVAAAVPADSQAFGSLKHLFM